MPLPDEFHRMLQNLIKEKNAKSPEDLNKFLKTLQGKTLDQMFTNAPKDLSDEGKALDLVLEAQSLPIDKGRRRAKKALKFIPNWLGGHGFG
ncbi:MAG: hypothetical protein ACI9LN_003768, partial [Saprospiraceae bacterium]